MAVSSGVANKIRFLGLIEPEQVPALLAQVDVMVVSSHYETFGVVAAEALMAGVPVIATRCGGPECIVGHGDGLLVPPKQPAALREAMQQICENLSAYDTIAIAERARTRFSGDAIAHLLTAEYRNVLSHRLPSNHTG
jgi:glycosyltransferase involved in cell wall biosynthesis